MASTTKATTSPIHGPCSTSPCKGLELYDLTFVYLDAIPVILTVLPGKRWRAYLRPNQDDDDLVAQAAATLHRYVPSTTFVDVENPTRFHCHTRVAARFRSGRRPAGG